MEENPGEIVQDKAEDRGEKIFVYVNGIFCKYDMLKPMVLGLFLIIHSL